MRPLPLLVVLLVLAGCSGPSGAAAPAEGAPAAAYGLSPDNPIRVGAAGSGGEGGPARERAYLDRLRGPSGAPLSYDRAGSCCAFPTENGMMGRGLLDEYEVWGGGLDGRMTLYLNMYDPPRDGEADRAPPGLTLVPAE